MNKENAHLYLPLVQALADGKTILIDGIEGRSVDFILSPDRYRIKPTPRKSWYRVARKEDGVMIAGPDDNGSEEDVEGKNYFVEWLTGRIEYEIHEK